MQGGLQLLSLGPGCVQHGVVVHELLHTLGLWHEQSRLDRDNIYNLQYLKYLTYLYRDQYVTVHWDNIQPGMEDQFAKYQVAK